MLIPRSSLRFLNSLWSFPLYAQVLAFWRTLGDSRAFGQKWANPQNMQPVNFHNL